MEIKDFRDALEAYEKMLKLDRFDTEILKKKADALEKLKEFRLAKQTYEFMSSLEPNNVEIQSKIQELFVNKERTKKLEKTPFQKFSNMIGQVLENNT